MYCQNVKNVGDSGYYNWKKIQWHLKLTGHTCLSISNKRTFTHFK